MRQYLIVANRTVESPQLLEAIRERLGSEPARFHLLVPEDHLQGMTWEEGQARVAAKHRLAHAIEYFAGLGIEMTGDVDTTPVDGVANILVREGQDHFDEILISTLPTTVSRWFKMDAADPDPTAHLGPGHPHRLGDVAHLASSRTPGAVVGRRSDAPVGWRVCDRPRSPVQGTTACRTVSDMAKNRWTDEVLDPARLVGDPLADDLVGPLLDDGSASLVSAMLAQMRKSHDVINDELPVDVAEYLEISAELPSWADPAKLEAAEDFFGRAGFPIVIGLFCYSLPEAYAAEKGAQVLAQTGRLDSDARRRILETGQFVIDVMAPGGLAPGGAGIHAAQRVRLMHAAIRHLILFHGHEGDRRWDDVVGAPHQPGGPGRDRAVVRGDGDRSAAQALVRGRGRRCRGLPPRLEGRGPPPRRPRGPPARRRRRRRRADRLGPPPPLRSIARGQGAHRGADRAPRRAGRRRAPRRHEPHDDPPPRRRRDRRPPRRRPARPHLRAVHADEGGDAPHEPPRREQPLPRRGGGDARAQRPRGDVRLRAARPRRGHVRDPRVARRPLAHAPRDARVDRRAAHRPTRRRTRRPTRRPAHR